MGQHVAFQVLLLLERLLTARCCAWESSTVALEVPVQFASADELLVHTDRALELQLLTQKVRARGRRLSGCRGTQEQSGLGLVLAIIFNFLLFKYFFFFDPVKNLPLTSR